MKRIILAFFIIIVCISCHREKRVNHPVNISEIILFSKNTGKTIENVVDSVAYLTLETTDESVFSYADKMIVRDGRIYIADYRKAKLLVFDELGNFIFSINKMGRGPGEYLRLSAFTVDDKYIYLMDIDSEKLRRYSLSGEYINEYKLPVYAMDISVFDNGDIMLATAPLDPRGFASGQSNHRIFIADNELKIHTSLFEYDQQKIDPIGKQNYLSENETNITFHTVGSDTIHIFSKANQNDMEHLLVDFGDNRIPDKYRSNIEGIDEGGYNYIYSTPVLAGKYLSLEINLGEYFEAFLYDTGNHQLFCQQENDCIIFPPPTGGSDGKYYTLMSGISQYRALVDGGFPKAPAAVEKHMEEDKAIMIVYIMKK